MLSVAPALEFYISLYLGYLLLLLLISFLKRSSLCLLKLLRFGLVAVIKSRARVLNMQSFVRRSVKEVSVVRNNYNRLFI